MKKAKTSLFFLIITLFSGCAVVVPPYFEVKVDSISSQLAESKKTYILLPGLKGVEPTDLQFKEYSTYAERALASRGFLKAEKVEDANILIFLVYGIGNPQENLYSYALPVWGQTGVSSSSTFGTLNTFGGTATYSGTTTYNPTYGITGFMPGVGSYTTYFRFAIFDAIDLDEYKNTQKIAQLWQTIITSTGSSDDLRFVFPILVAAAKPYLGTNTGKKVDIALTENDKAVIEIRGISTQNSPQR